MADAGKAAAWLFGVAGGVLAMVTSTQITEQHAAARALVFTLSQTPGVLAALGLAALLVGTAPRLSTLVWGATAWSIFATTFGVVVDLPEWARDLTFISHVYDPWGNVEWTPLLIQGAVGLAGIVLGRWAHTRRDAVAE